MWWHIIMWWKKGGKKVANEKYKLTLRLPKWLKEKLQEQAKQEDLSLNQLIVKITKQFISSLED